MYKEYFRFTELPFSIAPDPRFLFMSARHREALAHLMYGLEGEGGFVLLTGEVGTGKTTVCRCLLEQVPPNCDVAFIMNPRLSAAEMLATICDEFHLQYPDGNTSIKVFVYVLNVFLLRANARGRKAVLIIDEAQNLDPDVLEQLRLLTNLETNTRKLLQIVLLGQPELLGLLQRPELRQVAQRVVARYHLTHLSKLETSAYVAHRLRVSGAHSAVIPDALIGQLYRATRGIPRLINVVCDRALLGAYVEGKPEVTSPVLKKAAAEVLGAEHGSRRWPLAAAAAAAVLVVVGVVAFMGMPWLKGLVDVAPKTAVAPAVQPKPAAAAAKAMAAPEVHAAESPATKPSDVVPVAAVAPEPRADLKKPADTLDWPAALALEQAEGSAFHALLSRYGVDYKPFGSIGACRHVESFGLRCMTGRGTLETLRQLNQPVILQIHAQTQQYPVVLEQITGDTGTFIVGGERRLVAIGDLTAQWPGDYLVLWRPPPGYQRALEPGARSPVVAWLRDALSSALAQPRVPGEPTSFDPALAAQVRSFQTQQGLLADGVVGPLTLIRLNLALDPRLVRLTSDASERKGA